MKSVFDLWVWTGEGQLIHFQSSRYFMKWKFWNIPKEESAKIKSEVLKKKLSKIQDQLSFKTNLEYM